MVKDRFVYEFLVRDDTIPCEVITNYLMMCSWFIRDLSKATLSGEVKRHFCGILSIIHHTMSSWNVQCIMDRCQKLHGNEILMFSHEIFLTKILPCFCKLQTRVIKNFFIILESHKASEMNTGSANHKNIHVNLCKNLFDIFSASDFFFDV